MEKEQRNQGRRLRHSYTMQKTNPPRAPKRQFHRVKAEQRQSLLERAAQYLERSSAVRIWVRFNQSATIVALAVALGAAILAYVKYDQDNMKSQDDRITKAWDTLARMSGKSSNGGQINAIQILVKSGIALDNVDLTKMYLAGAALKGAQLRGANLAGANLTGANLHGANLSGANLQGTTLYHSNLAGVTFDDANLASARLAFSKLDVAVILAKSLSRADLTAVRFVEEDDDGNDAFDAFWDTVGESPRADVKQRTIDEACSNVAKNQLQDKRLPFKLPTRPCSFGTDYGRVERKEYEIYGQ